MNRSIASAIVLTLLGGASPAAAATLVPTSDTLVLPVGSTCSGPPRSIAALTEDRLVAVWTEPGVVRARLFDAAGAAAGDPIAVAEGVPGFSDFAQAIATPDGGFVVVWHDAGQYSGRSFDAAGLARGPAFDLGSSTVGMDLLAAADGALVAVARSSTTGLRARWFAADGTPAGPQHTLAENVVTADGFLRVIDGAATVDDRGRLAAFWIVRSDSPTFEHLASRVHARTFERSGAPAGPETVIEATEDQLFDLQVAWRQEVGGAVVWRQRRQPEPDVFTGRRLAADGRAEGENFLLPVPGEQAYELALAVEPGGNLAAIWIDWPANDLTLAVFGPDGAPLRPAVALGLGFEQGDFPSRPAVFPRAHGRLLASWLRGFSVKITPNGCEHYPEVYAQGFAAGCLAGERTLCLGEDGRFEVAVEWQDFQGGSGRGRTAPLTGDTGAFWFFRDANLELIAKLLDAREVDGHFWFFYGALSNVGYSIEVTDTETLEQRVYHNPSGTFASRGDTAAFPVGDGGSGAVQPEAAHAGPTVDRTAFASTAGPATPRITPPLCFADDQKLCLLDRFAVEVEWLDPRSGDAGHGQVRPATSDTGFFWFFDEANVELAVKVLDGRLTNGHFWVFFGSLTDVEFRLTVTDGATGAVVHYDNPGFHMASRGDTAAFPETP